MSGLTRKILEGIQELELVPARGFKGPKKVKHIDPHKHCLWNHEWTWIDFNDIPGYDPVQDPPKMPGPVLEEILQEMEFAEEYDDYSDYVDLMNQIAVQAMRVASNAEDEDPKREMIGDEKPLWEYHSKDDHFHDVTTGLMLLGNVTGMMQTLDYQNMHLRHIIELGNAVAKEAMGRAHNAADIGKEQGVTTPPPVYKFQGE